MFVNTGQGLKNEGKNVKIFVEPVNVARWCFRLSLLVPFRNGAVPTHQSLSKYENRK